MQTDQKLAAYIGLDWGDQRHALAVQPAAGGRVEHRELEQRPDTLHAWVAQLRRRFGGRPVGIALEQRKGAVVHALLQYEFVVLYPINPKALARYREALHPSGAKDDPTDAALLLDLLRSHRAQRRPLDEFEDQCLRALGVFQPVDGADVGVVQRGEDLGFPLEAGQAVGVGREGVRQDFERDTIPVELRVAGAEDFAHAARADLGGDGVGTERGAGLKMHVISPGARARAVLGATQGLP